MRFFFLKIQTFLRIVNFVEKVIVVGYKVLYSMAERKKQLQDVNSEFRETHHFEEKRLNCEFTFHNSD